MPQTKYDNALLEARELTRDSRAFRPTVFRDDLIVAVAKAIAARRSVLLVGPSGVGKTKIVEGLALHLTETAPRKLYERRSGVSLNPSAWLMGKRWTAMHWKRCWPLRIRLSTR